MPTDTATGGWSQIAPRGTLRHPAPSWATSYRDQRPTGRTQPFPGSTIIARPARLELRLVGENNKVFGVTVLRRRRSRARTASSSLIRTRGNTPRPAAGLHPVQRRPAGYDAVIQPRATSPPRRAFRVRATPADQRIGDTFFDGGRRWRPEGLTGLGKFVHRPADNISWLHRRRWPGRPQFEGTRRRTVRRTPDSRSPDAAGS